MRTKNSNRIKAEKSTGNIFADLGLPHPERELLKAKLTIEIYRLIRKRNLTQAEAGKILGIKQPHVSALMRNRAGSFSVERLMDFLTALGQDVEISLKPARERRGEVYIVAWETIRRSLENLPHKVRDYLVECHSAKLPLQIVSMQRYVYSFQSSVGMFWIRPERNKSWGLYIGGEGIIELLGYYSSGFAAADSVYMQTTRWDGWDRRKRIDAPSTLLLWSKKPVK